MAKKTISEKNGGGIIPQLVFREDFKIDLNGELTSGSEVEILFDSQRLPFERSVDEKGKSAWSIAAFYQCAPGGEINRVELKPAKATRKKIVEETVLKGVLSIPAGSEQAIIWFMNTGKTGQYYYDSDFGKNYRLPVSAPAAAPEPAKKTRAKSVKN
ncbi:MAG: hypothetical protein JSS81_28275 [Acidobacteria bacterium]|nr:hypothetical protein [Acidobacteriota bacterium]